MTRTGELTAVVLAAGRSSRMGQAKQLMVVDGVPMVVQAITVALQSEATRVVVITGAYATEIAAVLQPLLQKNLDRLQLVHNEAWETGQASSVCRAVDVCGKTTDALLFLPVDQPFLPVILLQQLLVAWQQGATIVAPAVDGALRGAPAIFDHIFFAELAQLTGDTGARPLLQRHQQRVVTVPAQAAWLRDIDTPADLVS